MMWIVVVVARVFRGGGFPPMRRANPASEEAGYSK
jgi:hypothetical protein